MNIPAEDPLILCANARLAQSLRAAHGEQQQAAGKQRWRPLMTATLNQWLTRTLDRACFVGVLPAERARVLPLSAAQEELLWEQVIAADSAIAEQPLFDLRALAQAAQSANELVEDWNVSTQSDSLETAAFLRWRETFRQELTRRQWIEPVRWRKLQFAQIVHLAKNAALASPQPRALSLPRQIYYAGFDRLPPQMQALFAALRETGVSVAPWRLGLPAAAVSRQLACADLRAECRTAAAWLLRERARHPKARLAIVAVNLAVVKPLLLDALDEALHPECFDPQQAEAPRLTDVSLGESLDRVPLVSAALELLQLAAKGHVVEQQRLGEILRNPYCCRDDAALSLGSQVDAVWRERLPPLTTWTKLGRLAAERCGLTLPAPLPNEQHLPSQWSQVLLDWLKTAGWPGGRALSSHEWQAQSAFIETVRNLNAFDALLGRIRAQDAVRRLLYLCQQRIHQPQSSAAAPYQILGLLEASAAPLDGLWVLGMNEGEFPPPPRPHPLLDSAAQRAVGAPNASAQTQAEFAAGIFARLAHSAPQVLYSWAQMAGERELRPSIWLADSPAAGAADYPQLPPLVQRLAEQLHSQGAGLQTLDDNQAPPPLEPVRGGTGLLRAQAICPAWAFYRYRLHARALAQAVDGLSAAQRGDLLHAALEQFWRARIVAQSSGVFAPSLTADEDLSAALATAIDTALARANQQRWQPLSARVLALEGERLRRLLTLWLEQERNRPTPFQVLFCEQAAEVTLAGLPVQIKVDRIDGLADGRQMVIDYKSAASVSSKGWFTQRITEPQLPLYAAYVAPHCVAAAFAQVRFEGDRRGFVGIAAEDDLLPKVKALGAQHEKEPELYPAAWEALLTLWQERLSAIAEEVLAGVAGVRIEDDAALAWCEVSPLLRLAEWRSQREMCAVT